MFESVRRVVTVIDDQGVSRIESDGPPPGEMRLPNTTKLTDVWTIDALPADVSATGDRDEFSFLCPAAGIVFRRAEVPPDTVRFVDEQGRPRTPAPDEGMHQTPTVDLIQVLEGELWLLMPTGEEAHLQPGDIVVQRGTVHAWRNRTDRVTRYFAVMIDATLPNGQDTGYTHAVQSSRPVTVHDQGR